jgi:hypothetical protein
MVTAAAALEHHEEAEGDRAAEPDCELRAVRGYPRRNGSDVLGKLTAGNDKGITRCDVPGSGNRKELHRRRSSQADCRDDRCAGPEE